jgi:hypothetical protein
MKGWLARAAASTPGTVGPGPGSAGGSAGHPVTPTRWIPGSRVPTSPIPGTGAPSPRPGRPASPTARRSASGWSGRSSRCPRYGGPCCSPATGTGGPAEQVAAELGISLAQQRCILNRARAAVRDELAGRREPRGVQ